MEAGRILDPRPVRGDGLAQEVVRDMPPVAAPVSPAPRGRSFPPLWVVLVAAVFLPDWMYCADRPEAPEPDVVVPAVKQIDVIPPRPYATPASDLVLHARMLDAANGVLPAHPNLQWTAASGLTQATAGGDSIVLHVTATAPGTNLLVTATIASTPVSGSATIRIVAATAPGPADVIFANGRTVAPDVVLIRGKITSGPVKDSLVAFAKTGVLGGFSDPGQIFRLATDQRFLMWSGNLLPGRKAVDIRTTSAAPFTLSLAVFDATSLGALSEISDDIEYAVTTFARQRTGLTFTHASHATSLRGTFTLSLGNNSECLDLTTALDPLGVPPNALAPNRLTVVYVDDILEPVTTAGLGPEPELQPAGLRGYTCPYDALLGTVIIISKLLRSGTTLAHELGHALGLVEPWWGHIDGIAGFSYTNLMWAFGTDAQRNARSVFSLGQAFRVNVDNHSWLFHVALPTWTKRDCSDDPDDDAQCPKLAREIVPLP